MNILDLGSVVRVLDDRNFRVLEIDSFRHRDGTTTWVLIEYPFGQEFASRSFCTKRAAMDAAMVTLATRKLQGKIK